MSKTYVVSHTVEVKDVFPGLFFDLLFWVLKKNSFCPGGWTRWPKRGMWGKTICFGKKYFCHTSSTLFRLPPKHRTQTCHITNYVSITRLIKTHSMESLANIRSDLLSGLSFPLGVIFTIQPVPEWNSHQHIHHLHHMWSPSITSTLGS